MISGMLLSHRLGCASAWHADVLLLLLFMVQGECTSVFSVVLLAVGLGLSRYACGFVCRCSKCQDIVFHSSGMLPSAIMQVGLC